MPIWIQENNFPREIGKLWVQESTSPAQIGKVWVQESDGPKLIYTADEILFINNTSSGTIQAWQLYAWASSSKWNNVKVNTGSTGSTSSTNGNVYVKPEMQSNKMRLQTNHSTIGGNWTCIQSDERVDMTGASTLRFTYYRNGTRVGALPNVGVVTERPANTANGSQIPYLTWGAVKDLTNSTSSTTIDVNVSSLSGNYYICFNWTATSSDSGPRDEQFYITKIELL